MKNRTDIFEKYPIPKAVWSLALPTILGMLVTVIYNLADTFFVGQLNDVNQIAAVSITMPIFMLLMAIGTIFGIGSGTYISRMLGAKENLKVKTKYIKDPNPTEVKEPRVYIYNTHQLENYSATNFEDYNITPNVLMASYMLKEKLNKNNIPSKLCNVSILVNSCDSYDDLWLPFFTLLEKYWPNHPHAGLVQLLL